MSDASALIMPVDGIAEKQLRTCKTDQTPTSGFSLRRTLLAVVMTIMFIGGSQPAHAEPITLSFVALKFGVPLLVAGFNHLLNKSLQPPDVQYQTITNMYAQMRGIHSDVLQNRNQQLEIYDLSARERVEIKNLIIDASETVLEGVAINNELNQIIDLLAETDKVFSETDTIRKSKGHEKKQHKDVLLHTLSNLKTYENRLDRSVRMRPMTVPPRLFAIQVQWNAYATTMKDFPAARETFVREAGMWLETQRHPTWGTKPTEKTLGDFIYEMERHVVGITRYLSELGKPCSALWGGYLTIEDYEWFDEEKNIIMVKKVGISQAKFEHQAQEIPQAANVGNFTRSALTQKTTLKWSHLTKELQPMMLLDKASLSDDLVNIHQHAFSCDNSLRKKARQRLRENVPEVPEVFNQKKGRVIPDINYYPTHDSFNIEELIDHQNCEKGSECRTHWERVHSRLEVAKALLTTLYAIRSEVNRTLEWLAAKTANARCAYHDAEPRVCVFDPNPNTNMELVPIEQPILSDRNSLDDASTPDVTNVTGINTDAEEWARMLTANRFETLREEQQRFAQDRWKEIARMDRELRDRIEFVIQSQRIHDQHLEEVAKEAAQMAWVQLAVNTVVNQIIELAVDAVNNEIAESIQKEADSASELAVDAAGEATVESARKTAIPAPSVMPSETVVGLEKRTLVVKGSDKTLKRDLLALQLPADEYGNGINPLEKLALVMPNVPPKLADFLAGIGDSMTLQITKNIRDWVGLSAEINTESGEYFGGTVVGIIPGGAAGAIKSVQLLKILKETGKASQKIGNLSVLIKAGHKQRTQGISLIYHGSKGMNGRLLAFDVVTNWKDPSSFASKLPHFHIWRFKAHLPWEPPWLIPAYLGSRTPEAE